MLDDSPTQASFVRECLLWCGFWPHPNLARAYGVCEMGDAVGLRPFLALEYAEGNSLRTLLQEAARQPNVRHLPLNRGLYLAQQIASGLAYLHRPDPAYLRTEPTVHRDLKPENVLIMDTGRAVITDFGLAKAIEESPRALAILLSEASRQQPQLGRQAEEAIIIGGEQATETTGLHTVRGVAMGTLPYMSPEQWEDARYAGTPTDIYALGIMLSEMFTGRHPLLDLDQPHSAADWRRAHREPHPHPIHEVAPDVPAVVETIYQRCLAREPSERPTADEVLAALHEGARAAGFRPYVPYEVTPHTPYNEFRYWHVSSIAYDSFALYDGALAHNALDHNDRALQLARHLRYERPELLPDVLMELGTILKGLGYAALEAGNDAEAAWLDRQAERAYQDALLSLPPAATVAGRRGRAFVWNQIGSFNNQRNRYNYAEDAYRRSLALQPDLSVTYYNRARNQMEWGEAEARAERRESAIAHVRQARVYAVTAHGMNDPTAQRLLQDIEAMLGQLGVHQ
jgi:serine/threonine protein kinase